MKKNIHCTAYDYAMFKGHVDFCSAISLSCLTKPSMRRSLIIPPKEEIKRINAIKNIEKRVIELESYILKRGTLSKDRLVELSKGKDNYLVTLFGKNKYIITMKDKKLLFNGIPVKIIVDLPDRRPTLFKATKPLKPSAHDEIIPKERMAGAVKKKRKLKVDKKLKNILQTILI